MFRPTDILACFGTDGPSRLIRAGTFSPLAPPRLRRAPSHVAIVSNPIPDHDLGEPTLIESTTLTGRPCLYHGRPVAGVQVQDPLHRIRDYVTAGGHVDIWRTTPAVWRRLDRTRGVDLMHDVLIREYVEPGIGYDLPGALLSGLRTVKILAGLPLPIHVIPAAGLRSMFCSEVIARALMVVGLLNWSNPAGFNPAGLLRELARTGVYQHHRRLSADTMPGLVRA